MWQDYSCGVIVFHREKNGDISFLLVQNYGNVWGFPKGHQERNETKLQTAIRELKEETAISDVTIIPDLYFGENYIIVKKKTPNINKNVNYFVAESITKNVTRQKKEIKQIQWFNLEESKSRITPQKKEIIDAVFESIS